MAASYDLFVLLDPEIPEERRTAIVERVRSQIGSGGATLKGDADWGMRRLSYEIDHRREAQYHLFQFEGTREVLTELDRSLSIEDAVLRHRIIRLPGEAPEVTPRPSEEPPRRAGEDRPGREGGRDRREDETADEPAEVAAAAPAAEGEPVQAETATAAPEAAPAAPEAAPAPPEPAAAPAEAVPEPAAEGAPEEPA
jgi:small subunit ribosomal protein S6